MSSPQDRLKAARGSLTRGDSGVASGLSREIKKGNIIDTTRIRLLTAAVNYADFTARKVREPRIAEIGNSKKHPPFSSDVYSILYLFHVQLAYIIIIIDKQ